MTNADKIRAMTDEELADFIDGGCVRIKDNVCDENVAIEVGCDDRDCTQCWLGWLKKEANDER